MHEIMNSPANSMLLQKPWGQSILIFIICESEGYMFAFIDESGFPTPTDSSPHSVLLGLCVKKEDIRDLSSRVYQAKEQIYGGKPTMEIKAKNLINPRIMKPNFSKNKSFTDKLFEIIAGQNVGVYAMVLEKPDAPIITEPEKLPKHYTFLLYRINAHGQHSKRIVAVVFDGQTHADDKDISERFHNFVYNADPSVTQNLLEMPLFVSSDIVAGIQLADLMAGVVRHYHNLGLHCAGSTPNSEFAQWVSEKHAIINAKTRQYKINQRMTYGIYLARKNSL